MLAESVRGGLAGSLPQPPSHWRTACREEDDGCLGRLVTIRAEPDEPGRWCYSAADARRPSTVRGAVWTHLHRLRQRKAACGNVEHPGTPPGQRPGGGVAGISRAAADDHA